jgi:hypothetical protein
MQRALDIRMLREVAVLSIIWLWVGVVVKEWRLPHRLSLWVCRFHDECYSSLQLAAKIRFMHTNSPIRFSPWSTGLKFGVTIVQLDLSEVKIGRFAELLYRKQFRNE